MSAFTVTCHHCGREFVTNFPDATPRHNVIGWLVYTCPGSLRLPEKVVRQEPVTYSTETTDGR